VTPVVATIRARPSFEQVYASELLTVWRTVRRFGVPAHAVEDVVQQVFVAVYRQLENYEGRCALSTWVFAIVLRTVSNHRRAYRRKGAAHALASLVTSEEELVATGDSPLEQAEKRQATEIAREVLSQMNSANAKTFVMFEIMGFTALEIAEASDVPINTVYSRLRHARQEFGRLAASFSP
jgi:RNA polymerase sigma-70 factor, ECF subfamily